jgi:hypothetical protein
VSVQNAGIYTDLNGFIAAREKLVDDWLASDHHVLDAAADWQSDHITIQCDETEVASDGFVYYIQICAQGSYPC